MSPNFPEPIATEEITWVRKDGSTSQIKVFIGRPYQLEDGDWACPTLLDGVDSRYPDVMGSSSVQSLSLAIRLVATRIFHLLDDGETLFFKDDLSAPFTLDTLRDTFAFQPPLAAL